ncbi:hypothetical protein H7F37_01050 [Winogradskyella sp. PAMC22761]|nr:hypothetical protein H7F37_01050 [Winogradskyella sp. PAMC22761]
MENIIELLKKAWGFLKKIVVKIFSFVKNMVNFFKAKIGIAQKRSPNVKAISLRIQKDLEKGNFNTVDIGLGNETIVNTFFDENTEQIMTDLTEVVSADSLDHETINKFGKKQMIILN